MDWKLQASRAIAVVPSDTINIPEPSTKTTTGAQTSATSNKLTDSGASFTSTVKEGYIVHNVTDGTIATVTAVDSDTVLSISADIFGSTETYAIYASTTRDCVVYVGVSGNLSVLTAGGDTVTLLAVPAGMIIPLNVKRINDTLTTATNIVAMW